MIEPISTPKRAGKFTEAEVKELARLVSECKMTESEAAITLGRKPEHWQTWKSRHKHSASFATLIAHTRGKMVDGLISKIKTAGDDYEIVLPNGKVINKRGDWRAPAWILEKVAPQFAPQQSAPSAQTVINVGLMASTLKRIFSDSTESNGKVIDCSYDDKKLLSSGSDIQTPIKAYSVRLPIRKKSA